MGSLYLSERYKLVYIIHKQSPKRDVPVPAFIYCTACILLQKNVINRRFLTRLIKFKLFRSSCRARRNFMRSLGVPDVTVGEDGCIEG